MARNVFHVVPNGTDWCVKHAGKLLTSHHTKEAAIQQGRAFALKYQPSQLVVHRANGTIEYEYTYGNDPFPPRG